MPIKVGDKIPAATLRTLVDGAVTELTTEDLFNGKTVALFAVPAAYTRTCSTKHLPGFVANADALKAKGVDTIVCMAVNDAFVMDAWGKDRNVGGAVLMVGDGNADLTRALGLDKDSTANGMGIRSQRFSMMVKDGVLKSLDIDPPGQFGATSAEAMLDRL
jgi:glutaredoxin/glutathione-dependent peroxiredoxin